MNSPKKSNVFVELIQTSVFLTTIGAIWFFWAWVGRVTNWFGLGKALEPFLFFLSIPAFLLSYIAIIFCFLGVLRLIGGPPKPTKDYNREDAARELDYFINGNWYDDDFSQFCATKYDDPLMDECARELTRVLLNLPYDEKDLAGIIELRDRLRASSPEMSLTTENDALGE